MRRRARMSRLMQLLKKRKECYKRMTKSKYKGQLELYPPHYEAIAPRPNALNAYQLKGLNPSKKRKERIQSLKPEKGTCKEIKNNKRQEKGFGIHTLSRKGYLK
jgi:hypothetical protein